MIRVALAGPMGSGKSTVGRVLAERWNVPFLDLDEEIGDIPGIFEREGEAAFRARERIVLAHLAKGHGVLALGGGTVVHHENVACLAEWRTIVLMARLETLQGRVGIGTNRPLAGRLPELYAARAASYLVAGPQVWTDGVDIDEVAHRVESLC